MSEWPYSTVEEQRIRLGTYLCLLNTDFKKRTRRCKSLLFMLRVANAEFSKKSLLVPLKHNYLEGGRFLVIFTRLSTALNHVEVILSCININIHGTRECYIQIICTQHISQRNHKKKIYAVALHRHLANSNVVSAGSSKVNNRIFGDVLECKKPRIRKLTKCMTLTSSDASAWLKELCIWSVQRYLTPHNHGIIVRNFAHCYLLR